VIREAASALSGLRPGKTRRQILVAFRVDAGNSRQDSQLRTAVRRAVRKARMQLAARWPRSTADIAAFHHARVALKCFRYQLELLASLGAVLRPECLRQLRSYQKRLGDLHDGQLMLIRLEKLAAKGRIEAPLHHFLRRILRCRATRLRRACLAPPTAKPGRLLPA
jgi:CHAD domain-containing protein